MADQIIYEDDYIIMLGQKAKSDTLIVTFNPGHFEPSNARIWGGPIVAKLKHASMGFLFKGREFAPSSCIEKALAASAEYRSSYSRVVTWGYSVGGSRALKFARPLGAQMAIAFSPLEFSLGARGLKDWQKKQDFDGQDATAADLPARTFLFYDPLEVADAQCVLDLIKGGATSYTTIPMLCVGHNTVHVFTRTMMADRVLAACLNDEPSALFKCWAQGRRKSPTRPAEVALRAATKHPDIAVAIYHKYTSSFLELSGVKLLIRLATGFAKLERHDKAHETLETAKALVPADNELLKRALMIADAEVYALGKKLEREAREREAAERAAAEAAVTPEAARLAS